MAASFQMPINGINTNSLRHQVYDWLREAMGRGELAPGEVIRPDDLSRALGVSRTPLRDALLQLEWEGFVTIRPRSGCVVRALTATDIRDLYQMIGALESSVIVAEWERITPAVTGRMRTLDAAMREALADDDFAAYYAANVDFHGAYLELSPNGELLRQVSVMRQRLYDFPRRADFVKEWETASVDEHRALVERLEGDDPRAAADFVRDVHWSWNVQRPFIEKYYPEATP